MMRRSALYGVFVRCAGLLVALVLVQAHSGVAMQGRLGAGHNSVMEGVVSPLRLQALMRLRGGAEAGKGDPRWIVQDRQDGKNVGSWHWEERDMMMWTREQLPELTLGTRGEMADFEGWSGHFEVTNVTTITGDCVIHLRKGRLWPLCDLNLVFAIKGECKKDGTSSPITGSVTFPEVTMDDRNDLEVRATTGAGGPASEVFGRWLRKEGYKTVENCVQKFLDALDAKAGQDKPPEDAAEKMRQALAAAEKMAQVNKVVASDIPTPEDDYEDKGPPTGKLELQEDFFCSARDAYDCLTVASVSLESKSHLLTGFCIFLFRTLQRDTGLLPRVFLLQRINAYTRCSDTVVELRVGGEKFQKNFSMIPEPPVIICKLLMSMYSHTHARARTRSHSHSLTHTHTRTRTRTRTRTPTHYTLVLARADARTESCVWEGQVDSTCLGARSRVGSRSSTKEGTYGVSGVWPTGSLGSSRMCA